MITRDLLDELLPSGAQLHKTAERLSGLDLSADPIPRGLAWLAEFVEHDLFSGYGDDRPEWRKTAGALGDWWPITMRGLEYKQSSNYLTAEGWPTGTTCWYVCVECGSREYIAAEDPETAIYRALIWVNVLVKRRAITPKERPHWEIMLLAEFSVSDYI